MDEIDDRYASKIITDMANLERIRSARIMPLNLRTAEKGALDTSNEYLYLKPFDPEQIHVITNICLVEIGSGTPQVFLGAEIGGVKYYLFSDTVATAEDSVNWSGQAIYKEGDRIFALLQNATAADEAVLTANGYSMRL